MKHLFSVLALACAPAFAGDKPPVSPVQESGLLVSKRDYIDHAVISGVFGVASRLQWPDEPGKAWRVAMIPGAAKEVLDLANGGKPRDSLRDLLADGIGAALGVSVGGLIVRVSRDRVFIGYRAEFE